LQFFLGNNTHRLLDGNGALALRTLRPASNFSSPTSHAALRDCWLMGTGLPASPCAPAVPFRFSHATI